MESTSDAQASSDYCDALKGAKTNLSTIDLTQINEKVYGQLTDELQKVAAVAPTDVQDDWDVVLNTLTNLHTLLASAGITLDDVAGLSAGQVPPGVDTQQLQKIVPKLREDHHRRQAQGGVTRDSAERPAELRARPPLTVTSVPGGLGAHAAASRRVPGP